MKILVVSPPTFGKNVGGAAKETFGNIDLLVAMGHEVTLYAIGAPGSTHGPLIEQFEREHNVTVRISTPDLSNWGRYFSRIFTKSFGYLDRAAYVFDHMINDPEFQTYIKEWKPDAAFFFCSYAWPVSPYLRAQGVPTILRSHNYEPDFFWESLNPSEWFNPLNWIRYGAKVIGEHHAVVYSDATASLPFDGMEYYHKWKKENIFVHTISYPYKGLRGPWVHRGKRPIDIMYLGASYLVRFHLRGAEELIRNIAPEVNRRAPGRFRFHILGSKMPAHVAALCDGKSIIYEGYVEDFDAFLEGMDAGAFPVYTGKVIKGKVFESMARAFPIVIPQNCLGGYVLKDKDEVLMAENTEEFVQAILSLQDDDLRLKISTGAAEFAKKDFSYEALTANLAEIIDAARVSHAAQEH